MDGKSPLSWDRSEQARKVSIARDAMRAGKEPDPSGIRPIILASWRRSRAAGVDPATDVAPIVLSIEEAKDLRAESALTAAAAPVLQLLSAAMGDHSFLLLLTDRQCRPIEVRGTPRVLEECERINVVVGSEWTEDRVGTDAVALSTLMGEPIQVHWCEHYAAIGDQWTGNAAPIHDPATGELLGTVSVYGYGGIAHPRALELVTDAALIVEQRLMQTDQRRRLHLFENYSLYLSRFPNEAAVCVNRQGMVLALSASALQILDVSREQARGCAFSDLPGIRSEGKPNPFSTISSPCDLVLRRGDDLLSAAVLPIKNEAQVAGFILQLKELKDRSRSRTATARRESFWQSVYRFSDVVGESPSIRETVVAARKAAERDSTVLIVGESGTGKELFAHAIHAASGRSEGPFVPLNCGGLNEDLLSSELFGYEDGAFTGASRGGRAGKLELADQGTLFLDEVETMSPKMQVHLLRFLEDARVIRIGGNRSRKVSVRIVAATNVDLRQSVKSHRFREDLFYRLDVLPLRVPPLRERRSDIPLLAQHILHKERLGKSLSPLALERLQRHDWPGNVRELRNMLLQAAFASAGGAIRAEDLPRLAEAPGVTIESPEAPEDDSLRSAERRVLLRVLEECDGQLSSSAARLKMHRVTLYRKLKRHGIRIDRRYR